MVPVICLTGAQGFIASHLLAASWGKPDPVFHLLGRSWDVPPPNYGSGHLRLFSGDLKLSVIEKGFVTTDATVINLAYSAGDNINENIAVADALVQRCVTAGARRLIHLSTAVVAGAALEDTVDEDTCCRPVTPYEKCKLAVEKRLREICRHRIDLAIVRPTAVFGKGGKNMATVVDFVLKNSLWLKRLRMSFFDSRCMNLVSVENLAAAIGFIRTLKRPVDGDCFIVSDDDAPENTFGGVSRLIHDAIGIPSPQTVPIPFSNTVQHLMLRFLRGPSVKPRRRYRGLRLMAEGFQAPWCFAERVQHYAKNYSMSNDNMP